MIKYIALECVFNLSFSLFLNLNNLKNVLLDHDFNLDFVKN